MAHKLQRCLDPGWIVCRASASLPRGRSAQNSHVVASSASSPGYNGGPAAPVYVCETDEQFQAEMGHFCVEATKAAKPQELTLTYVVRSRV